ncbi:MAG: DoxX family membrane protein [Bacteroidetes bacterium]|nr:DoxX family membrane protein [Bacteroidota bacterium]
MKKNILLILRVVVAVILLQTLFYKFTAHPDSVYIFTKVGLEPYGRIFIGIMELIAAILILIPKTIWLGAGLTVGILSGAIFMHLTILGININDDNGFLFFLALFTTLLSGFILWQYRRNIPIRSALYRLGYTKASIKEGII